MDSEPRVVSAPARISPTTCDRTSISLSAESRAVAWT